MSNEWSGLLKEVRSIELPSNSDARGVLTSIESGLDIPFEIKRIFYVHHISSDRGGHAHLDTDQVIIAISGTFQVELCDRMETIRLDMTTPTRGIYVPRKVFIKMTNFSPGAVCLVIASTHYDIKRSVRSWEEYKRISGA